MPGKYIVIGVSLFMRVQDIREDSNSHIAFTFGRFNPPTIGHEKLINAVKSAAGKYRIYISKSHEIKKNPLDYNTKMQYLNAMFPTANISKDNMRTMVEIIVKLYEILSDKNPEINKKKYRIFFAFNADNFCKNQYSYL